MKTFDYRNATREDIPAIVQFQLAMAKETENLELNPQVCAEGVLAVFQRPELGIYYVSDIEGVVAGSLLTTYEWSDWRNGEVWWLQSVYVRPEFRRQGVYRGLYAHIRSIALAREEVRAIRLYVDRRNVVARSVYESLGMNGNHYQVFEWLKD